MESVLLLLFFSGKRGRKRERERASYPQFSLYRPNNNYIFTSRASNKQTLSWSKTLSEKDFSLIGAARRVLSSRASPLCGTGRASLKFGASHLTAGLILAPIRTSFLSEKRRCEKRQVKERGIGFVGIGPRSHIARLRYRIDRAAGFVCSL